MEREAPRPVPFAHEGQGGLPAFPSEERPSCLPLEPGDGALCLRVSLGGGASSRPLRKL
jgi:hypothetical protein